MYKGKNIVGKSIISVATGEVLDKVRDVFFDAQNKMVLGFLVDEGGILSSARVLPFESVSVIGPDGVLVSSATTIVPAKDAAHASDIMKEDNVVVGTKIMTDDGKDLGKINDIFFDEVTGMIEGYEVTGGLFADAVSGRSYLPSPSRFKIGKDVALVPVETISLIEGQSGGLEAMTYKAEETIRKSGTTLQNKSTDITEGIKKAWEKTKEATAEITGRTEDKLEEERIKSALGRPVTRVILTPNDEPIINTGELITNKVVSEARVHGVLDMLLSSVYKDAPGFSSEELKSKPKEEGMA